MKKSFLFVALLFITVIASGQGTPAKEDNSFRIVAFVTLLAALFLAIRKFNGMKK